MRWSPRSARSVVRGCALAAAIAACQAGSVSVNPVSLGAAPPRAVREIGPPRGPASAPAPRVALPEGRFATVAVGTGGARKRRLVVHLHGLFSPPRQSCTRWASAALARSALLVCPEGDAPCPPAPLGPLDMTGEGACVGWAHPGDAKAVDADVERAVAHAEESHPGALLRDEGATLSGFSLGAELAWQIAQLHPGRWPYLVLGGKAVRISASELRAAGVRAVALLVGDADPERPGVEQRAGKVRAGGFPIKLLTMRGVGHDYPADIARVMAEALAFVAGD